MIFSGVPLKRLSDKKIEINLSLSSLTITSNTSNATKGELDRLAEWHFKHAAGGILPHSITKSKTVIPLNIKRGNYVGLIRDEMKELIGAIIGAPVNFEAVEPTILQQSFYYAKVTGPRVAKAIWLAHRFLIECAKADGIEYIVSSCSRADTTHCLNRILEKDGWTRQGHTSIWRVCNN